MTIPGYDYTIVTSEGISYPLSSGAIDIKINAREYKDIFMTVTFPASVNSDKLKLVVNQPAAEGKLAFPLAVYSINQTTSGSGTTAKTVEFSNKYGIYSVKLNSLQRMPWEDDALFPGKLSSVTESVAPNCTVLLSFWSEIPKSYSDTSLDIIIGQGVKESALSVGADVSDAFIRAAILEHTKTSEFTTILANTA